jgi:hypothetical protein
MRKLILLLLLLMGSGQILAKVNGKIEEAVSGSFPNVNHIEAKQLMLTNGQITQIQQDAKAALKPTTYRYYVLKHDDQTVGYAILIARKVRTKKAVVLYAFDGSGTLKFTEVMAFGEPPEFKPSNTWMGQFSNKGASAPLKMGSDIPTISGATLSARMVSDGARIARALLKIIREKH